MGLIRKLRNQLFQNLEFCIHDATLGADLASCGCRMDMVDGALERPDLACFEPGTVGFNSARVCDLLRCFCKQYSGNVL